MRILFLLFIFSFAQLSGQENKVLVFHKTDGFHHNSIPAGIKAIEELGSENNFEVTETDDAEHFAAGNLDEYDLVIFLNTTGNILDENQQEVFKSYIEDGGDFFGIHAAADTEYDWDWYGELVGAYFESHPRVQEAEVNVVRADHPTVAHLPETWSRTDEWYNYKEINPEMEVLLTLDENSYEGGKNGDHHPIAWFRELPGGGRSVYTGGGHTDEAFSESAFREHLRQSILFAMGEE